MSELKKEEPNKAGAFTPGDWASQGCMISAVSMAISVACVLALMWIVFSQTASAAGPFRRAGHNAMVAQSGITPNKVGRYEGVGMSTRGYDAAKRAACYWGQKTPVSIQYSKQGSRYYAVVRYR